MRGRKPKPTMLKDLHGSTEPRNPDEPMPTTGLDIVPAPDHFSPEMRQIWQDALEQAPPGMLKAIDAGVLEVWCVAYATFRRAVRLAATQPMILKAPGTEYPIINPHLGVQNRQAQIMMKAAAELGFSPTARPRVGVTAGGAELSDRRSNAGSENLDAFLARAPSIH